MDDVRERFRSWIDFTGLSHAEVARRLGCDESYPRKIVGGERRPGLDLAHELERLSAAPREDGKVWPGGPIRTEEWLSHPPTIASPPAVEESPS